MMTPAIVAVAPNGARKTKSDHPALPLSPVEIARDAAACVAAGAAVLHLHVRDSAGRHTLDADAYGAAIVAVRHAVGDDLIIQITTESAGLFLPAAQTAAVRAVRPEAVSVALRELAPSPDQDRDFAEFCAWMDREAILVQFILHDTEDLARFRDMRRRGIIGQNPAHVLFVIGRQGAAGIAGAAGLMPYLQTMAGPGAPDLWGVCAFGPLESPSVLACAALGGHPRVGFENNLTLADGSRAPDNRALVDQLVAAMPGLGRRPVDARAARGLLGAR